MDWLGKMMGLPQAFLSIDDEGKRGRGGGVVQVRLNIYTGNELSALTLAAFGTSLGPTRLIFMPITHSGFADGL